MVKLTAQLAFLTGEAIQHVWRKCRCMTHGTLGSLIVLKSCFAIGTIKLTARLVLLTGEAL